MKMMVTNRTNTRQTCEAYKEILSGRQYLTYMVCASVPTFVPKLVLRLKQATRGLLQQTPAHA